MDQIMAKLGQRPIRRALMRLALVVFVLRALFPVGTMPALAALAETGQIWALCGPAGNFVPASDADPAGTVTASDCPYALCLGASPVPPPALAVAPIRQMVVLTGPPLADRPIALPARGPPLGSRAPPHAVPV